MGYGQQSTTMKNGGELEKDVARALGRDPSIDAMHDGVDRMAVA